MVGLSSGIPPFRDPPVQEFIDRGIPRVRGSRASKDGEHPNVVLGRSRSAARGRSRAQVPRESPKLAGHPVPSQRFYQGPAALRCGMSRLETFESKNFDHVISSKQSRIDEYSSMAIGGAQLRMNFAHGRPTERQLKETHDQKRAEGDAT